MAVPDTLDAATLKGVMVAFRDALRSHQSVINRLNVYPVPDGDTGTNMALTLESVVAELDQLDEPDLPATCRAISHGSLMGARGNSGVILSQLLRGMADGLSEPERRDGRIQRGPGASQLAQALTMADQLARRAVMQPVEGTILTVARGAAAGALEAAERGVSLLDVAAATRFEAGAALQRTPALLPVLARAGVVDAGGTGLVLLFDALLSVLDGRPLPEPPDSGHRAVGSGSDLGADRVLPASHGSGDGLAGPRYEVMYLLDAPDEAIPSFKEVWAGLGDSIVVVGGEGLWNCHVHTDDIGGAVEASLDVGRPRAIRVTDLVDQVEEERWVREGAGTDGTGPGDTPPGPAPTTGVVAVATGDGIGRIFRSLGVHRVIAGGQTMNPALADLLAAVESLPSGEVLILPNNKNIRPVAEQVDRQTGKMVRVVPTNTVMEGFAALLAYDPGSHAGENATAMESSAQNIEVGEVTRAVRDSDSEAGPIRVGDWLGLSRRGIETVSSSLFEAARCLLDRLVTDEHTLVTLIEGQGSTSADTRRITEWLHEHLPDLVAEVHHGGQPLYPYLFSIE